MNLLLWLLRPSLQRRASLATRTLTVLMSLTGLLGLTILTGGCAAPMEGRVERTLARELPVVLGPGQDYRVDVRGLRLSGSMRRITATGQRVMPAVPQGDAPVLDRLDVELRDVAYSRERKRLERVGRAVVRARVTAGDISAFLQAHRGLEVTSLELRKPDRFLLQIPPSGGDSTTTPEASVSASSFSAEGRLVGAGSRVNFQILAVRALPDQHARAGVSPAQQWSASELSQRLSSLIDLSDLPNTCLILL